MPGVSRPEPNRTWMDHTMGGEKEERKRRRRMYM
jgi:hypothetical protein